MKVVLREDVPHLGRPGAIVNVKPGYARNYLIPQGLAEPATSRNIKMMEHKLKEIERQIDAARAEAEQVKARLAEISVTVTKPAGENEKLFGSVTTRDIEAALKEEASAAVLSVASNMPGRPPAQVTAAVQKVLKVSDNDLLRKQAQDLLSKAGR